MGCRKFVSLFALSAFATGAYAASITGSITIKKRLTKRSVTPVVSLYQRGAEVKLSKVAQEDPLAFEQSRVVVYIESPQPAVEGLETPTQVQIAQRDRRFTPDLVVAPVGSSVSFPNMDPIFHNVFSLSRARTFDLGSYDKGDTRTVVFERPGIVEVYCHLHPDMEATVVITPNRWYARPDAEGHYRLPDLPPGRYTVVAWHKTAGFFRKSILLENGTDAVADFLIPIDDAPARPSLAR